MIQDLRSLIPACFNRYWDSALDDHGDRYLLFYDDGCWNFNACFNFNRYRYFDNAVNFDFNCYRYFDDAINLDCLRDADETVYFYGYRFVYNLEHLLFDLNGLYQGPTYINVA